MSTQICVLCIYCNILINYLHFKALMYMLKVHEELERKQQIRLLL